MFEYPKISIIVPVYNAATTIVKCIQSLINQQLEEIEIIIVNDGSTDNSLEICQNLKKIDRRIKVIDVINNGVSSARNIGIDSSTGKYIGFIDSDDWAEPNMYSEMLNEMEQTKSDIVMCNYFLETRTTKVIAKEDLQRKVFNKHEIRHEIISNMISAKSLDSGGKTLIGSVWRLLINKEFLKKNNIYFNSNIHLMEDLLFAINMFVQAERLSYLDSPYYHYNQRENSAVNKYRENFLKENKLVYQHLLKLLSDKKLSSNEEIKTRLDNRYVYFILASIANETIGIKISNFYSRIQNIKTIIDDDNLKLILENIQKKEFKFRKRLVLNALYEEKSYVLFLYYLIASKV